MVLPAAASFSTVLPDPGAEIVAGVNAADTPLGKPASENETAALNPPLTVTANVTLLFDPAITESELDAGVA